MTTGCPKGARSRREPQDNTVLKLRGIIAKKATSIHEVQPPAAQPEQAGKSWLDSGKKDASKKVETAEPVRELRSIIAKKATSINEVCDIIPLVAKGCLSVASFKE